jgi:hypothetical protein
MFKYTWISPLQREKTNVVELRILLLKHWSLVGQVEICWFSSLARRTTTQCRIVTYHLFVFLSLCFYKEGCISDLVTEKWRSQWLSLSLTHSGRAHSLTCCGRSTFNFHYMLLLSGFSWFCPKRMTIIFHLCLLILNFFFPSWWYSHLCLT